MELRDDDEESTFLQRHRFAVGFVACIAVLGAMVAVGMQILGNHGAPAKSSQMTMIKLLPPPPTPPPTPPPQVQPQPTVQQMIEQKQMMEPETKPEKPEQKRDEPPKAHEKAPGPLGLNAKGQGAGDAFGLLGKPGGNGLLGNGDGGGGGTRWGWYAGEV
jgi:periplasmic protein TonB